MDWSWPAWLVSVAAVLASAGIARLEGSWSRRPGLDMGFVNHGGMWGDLLLLSTANAVIVPHVQFGIWIAGGIAAATAASLAVHHHWYRGDKPQGSHSTEHMWPSRPHSSWWRDLSWAGWAHVVYVIGELTVLLGFLLFPMPDVTIALVAIILTIHVPLGLLHPRWFLTGQIATLHQQPLLAPCVAAVWVVALIKS